KLRDECLNRELFGNLQEARVILESWRVEYNERRPHSALGYRTPKEYAEWWMVPGAYGGGLGQFVFLRCGCVIRARLLARSETTLRRRRRPRSLGRCAHRPGRDARR